MEETGTDGRCSAEVTLAIVAVLLGLLYWYSVSAFSKLQKMGIRHPKPVPFIGNVLCFQKGYWEGANEILKTYGPITGYYMGRRPMVLLSDPEAVKQVLQKDFSNFTNRMKLNLEPKLMSNTLVSLRDEKWRRVRSVLTPSFTVARMQEMCPLINQGCDMLLSNLQTLADSGEACNIQKYYAFYTMDIVTSLAFGTKVDSQSDPDHPLVQNSKKFLELFTPFKPLVLLTVAFPSIMNPILRRLPNKNRSQISSVFRRYIKETISLRDQQPANKRRRDFLQLMLDSRTSAAYVSVDHFDVVNQADVAAHVREESSKKTTQMLNEEEILGQTLIFLIAGYENTCSLLSFTTYLLATHPRCQEKLLKEVDEFAENYDGTDYNTVQNLPYMDMVIFESLRMYPPAFRFAREATADCTVMGCNIPAGTVLEIPTICMQNDPQYWAEPETFRPERVFLQIHS